MRWVVGAIFVFTLVVAFATEESRNERNKSPIFSNQDEKEEYTTTSLEAEKLKAKWGGKVSLGHIA